VGSVLCHAQWHLGLFTALQFQINDPLAVSRLARQVGARLLNLRKSGLSHCSMRTAGDAL
jgi:hypothetical protein